MPKDRVVKLTSEFAEKLKMIAELRSFKTKKHVSMGSLVEKWCEANVAREIDEAVAHSTKKNKALLGKAG